uniref:Uncharacterized protein n=1 Tax=Trichobilharzia regenti TaxID=157069 RepID=A0AA85J9P9_TRIRE
YITFLQFNTTYPFTLQLKMKLFLCIMLILAVCHHLLSENVANSQSVTEDLNNNSGNATQGATSDNTNDGYDNDDDDDDSNEDDLIVYYFGTDGDGDDNDNDINNTTDE